MKIRTLRVSAAALLAAGTFMIVQPAFTQAPAPPPGVSAASMFLGTLNPAAAPAGAYELDLEHHNVAARVAHAGFSYNVVRFGATRGVLTWDPAKPEAIKLDVTLSAKTHHDPIVYRIQPESAGFLNVEKFPEIRFVSTAVKKTGAMTADVQGQLTLFGVTKPAVIRAEMVGAGAAKDGSIAKVGFTGSMDVNWMDFAGKESLNLGVINIGLDAEFIKKKS